MLFGLGVSVVSTFVRWIYPTVPKAVACTGLAIGLGLISMAYLPFRTGPGILAAVGCAMLAGAVAWQFNFPTPERSPLPPPYVDQDTRVEADAGPGVATSTETSAKKSSPRRKVGEVVERAAPADVTNSVGSVKSIDQQGGVTAGTIQTVNQGGGDQ